MYGGPAFFIVMIQMNIRVELPDKEKPGDSDIHHLPAFCVL